MDAGREYYVGQKAEIQLKGRMLEACIVSECIFIIIITVKLQ